jgi:hypothetical protein
MGILSWVVEEGEADGVDLAGEPVAMAIRYSDDEEGSPWSWILYLDNSSDESRREALEAIWTGRLGGDAEKHFPWAWKPSDLLAVRPVEIDVNHTRWRQRRRIRDQVSGRIRDRYPRAEPVTCVIPGHYRTGREVYAEEIQLADDGLSFDFQGRCGYESTFEYSSAKAS